MNLGTQNLTQEQLEAQAAEQGISVDELKQQNEEKEAEVRTELEKRAAEEDKTVDEILTEDKELAGMIEKYEGDPKKMAKALKASAREATKLSEKQKTLEEEYNQLQARLNNIPDTQDKNKQDVRKAMKENYQKRYPTLDDDTVEAIIESNLETAMTMKNYFAMERANEKIAIEVRDLEKLPHYQKYKDEINKMISQQPIQFKMSPGIAKRCYQSVIGAHIDDILKESGGTKDAGHADIDGHIGVKGPKPSASAIGAKGTGLLTSKQARQAQDMGLKPSSYLAILNKRKATAKANGLPEPQLISDKVAK